MKRYYKIKNSHQVMEMPNPIRITIANPTEKQKELIAQFDNWLEGIEEAQPEFDESTQYLEMYWEEENGKAVQKWEIKEKPVIEESNFDIEDLVNLQDDIEE